MTRNNKKYEFALRYNPDAIRYYNDYPRTEPVVYFGAPASSVLKEDILRQLYPVLSKISKTEAAAFLLQFVQQEFDYTSAYKKGERIPVRFAEEVIASKSGDDQSKVALFSWLTRILLRLPVVGVQFPGYCSSAICFDEPIDGDFYFWKRARYLIADPTFRNAPIGVMMPEFSGLTPQLIELPNEVSPLINGTQIWKLAYKLGARRGGTSQDLIVDKLGRTLITGYFAGWKSNNPFIACFSEGNALQWIRRFEGEGKAAAFAITKVNENEIYIAGFFNGKLEMDGKTIQSAPDRRDLFLAQFNQGGELIWMKSVQTDSAIIDQGLTYLVKFDRTGNSISIQWRNEDLRNVTSGFIEATETGLVLTGSLNFNVSMFYPFPKGGKDDVTRDIDDGYNRLKVAGCHSNVTGLIAILTWLQKPGNEITGNQIQSFIIRKNPLFAVNYPLLFNTFGRIALLKNEDGIISLKTTDYKSLLFNSLKEEDRARFIVSVFGNGDACINVISGFQNMGNPALLKLNSLLIDFSAGNLILDYDDDHTLKTILPVSGL